MSTRRSVPAGKVVQILVWEEPHGGGWSAKSDGWPAIEVTGGESRFHAVNELRAMKQASATETNMGDGTRLNRDAFEQLIREDVEWLMQQPRTPERDHIWLILGQATNVYYPRAPQKLRPLPLVEDRTPEQLREDGDD